MASKPLNMPMELISLIIDQAAHYFPKVKIRNAFTEPLIYPHLMIFLALAKSKFLFTAVTTNAFNLKDIQMIGLIQD